MCHIFAKLWMFFFVFVKKKIFFPSLAALARLRVRYHNRAFKFVSLFHVLITANFQSRYQLCIVLM
jgi:hypothetical protein